MRVYVSVVVLQLDEKSSFSESQIKVRKGER